MKQKLTELNEEINNSTVIFGDFKTIFSTIDRTTSGQKICKRME